MPPYSKEFRQQILGLVRAEPTAEELSKESEPFAQCFRKWIKQDERDHDQRRTA